MNYFDQTIFSFMSKIRSEAVTDMVTAYTNIGYVIPMAIIVASIAIYLFCTKKKKYGYLLIGTMITEAILNTIIKYIVKRPRPMYFGGVEAGYSFPSGHAMAAITLAGILVYIIEENCKNPRKRVYQTIIIIAGIAMGVSRVYLGVHYSTDIIGAWIFGTAWVYTCVKLIKQYYE